jgi:glucose-1-phosphate cytidylyltransferase
MVPVGILCGGRGTRLRRFTEDIPKVLVEVGGRPILWHIMKGYEAAGFSRFVLAAGYLKEKVQDYFATPAGEGGPSDGWLVDVVDTGQDTNTGGRILALRDRLTTPEFFVTYGDGVADIDHQRLLDFHRAHGRLATVTVVRPTLPFGMLEVGADSRVTSFVEKPRAQQWINGGFFVFSQGVFDYLEPDAVLEAEPMKRLAADGELVAHQHEGFWDCMDTYKDNLELNAAWASGEAPWCTWPDGGDD